MKFLNTKIFTILILSLTFQSCASDEDEIYLEQTNDISVNSTDEGYLDIEIQIFDLINKHRQEMGLGKLKTLNTVSKVSNAHTKYMIEMGKVSHDNFPSRSQELMKQAGAKLVGENVAFGYSTAVSVFNAWLKSEGHREIIEHPDYTHFGISTDSNEDGRNYFTNMFIKM